MSCVSNLPKLENLDAPLTPVPGDIPSPLERPSGCVFHTRCGQIVGDACQAVQPDELPLTDTHKVACHIYREGTR